MTFRRRRRINWFSVVSLLIGLIGIGSLIIQRVDLPVRLPRSLQDLPLFPQPTPTPTPIIDDGSAMLRRADSLFDEGKLDEAAEQYGLAVSVIEKAYSDFLLLADRLESKGDTVEAAARRSDAQSALLRAATAYTRWCKVLALRGRGADASARCSRAIEINNRSAEGYAFLALAYDRSGEYDKAIAAAQRATDLDADFAEGWAFLAEAYADKAPFEKRNLETALKAVKINDRSAFAQRTLGWVYETEGKYREAALAYTQATELMPNLGYFYLDLCRAQRARKLLDEAVSACTKATELDPLNAETYDRLGQIFFEKFENQKALAQFEKATEVDPTYAAAHGHQGWVYYYRMFAWEKAAAAFAKALELGAGKLSPGPAAEFNNLLGWSYYNLGRCKDARSAFDRALGLLARDTSAGAADIIASAQDGLRACEGKP